jgi:hypothetical protein
VAAAGDQDGDGSRDLLVGAASPSAPKLGDFRIISGVSPPGTLDPALATWTRLEADGPIGSRQLLDSAGFGGDGDGDGETDVMVQEAGSGLLPGVIWLVPGPVPRGESAIDDVAEASFTLGSPAGDAFGLSYVGLDWNSDGIQDLVASARDIDEDDGAGTVRVFLGPFSGVVGPNDASLAVPGDGYGQSFGFELRTGGDLDGDGAADLLVEGYSVHEPRPTVFGFAAGSSPTVSSDALVAVTTHRTAGAMPEDMAAFDADLDGLDDLVVSVGSNLDTGGTTWLLHGPLAGTVAAESAADVALTGGRDGDFTGYYLSTGDLDGDGNRDLAVSDYIFGRLVDGMSDGQDPLVAGEDGGVWILYGGCL